MTEKAYSKYAWIILVVLGLLELQFALTLAISGPAAIDNANLEIQGIAWKEISVTSNEASLIDYVARSWGMAEALAAITMIVIAAVPFRKVERWSWYFSWIFPAFYLMTVFRNLAVGATSVVIIDSVGGIIFSIALLLPYRKFFPKA
jgi:hypothetical protein